MQGVSQDVYRLYNSLRQRESELEYNQQYYAYEEGVADYYGVDGDRYHRGVLVYRG